ncbi:hypothetical protein RRG08_011616 [Elysia crispata]|uniref:Uncharacterized protein n=1 Tax=Elysia crispata TaxID=231223 RepID=A0AAE1CJI5_9GAST|nr:hypothetical protein RRG08_011616 [Elysia crispata]
MKRPSYSCPLGMRGGGSLETYAIRPESNRWGQRRGQVLKQLVSCNARRSYSSTQSKSIWSLAAAARCHSWKFKSFRGDHRKFQHSSTFTDAALRVW